MQPGADDVDVALWQVGKADQGVFDGGLSDPVGDGFAGEHVALFAQQYAAANTRRGLLERCVQPLPFGFENARSDGILAVARLLLQLHVCVFDRIHLGVQELLWSEQQTIRVGIHV